MKARRKTRNIIQGVVGVFIFDIAMVNSIHCKEKVKEKIFEKEEELDYLPMTRSVLCIR